MTPQEEQELFARIDAIEAVLNSVSWMILKSLNPQDTKRAFADMCNELRKALSDPTFGARQKRAIEKQISMLEKLGDSL